MPYTIDLVRLAASAHLAIDGAHLKIEPSGRLRCHSQRVSGRPFGGGTPFVLAESHVWLREMVHGVLRDPKHFWAKIGRTEDNSHSGAWPCEEGFGAADAGARTGLPGGAPDRRAWGVSAANAMWRSRSMAGDRSPARPRPWRLRRVCGLATARVTGSIIRRLSIRRFACPDPFVRLKQGWIGRRLAPDCSRVELISFRSSGMRASSLFAMGFETANVHLGNTRAGKAIAKDFGNRPKKWLHEAAVAMGKAVKKRLGSMERVRLPCSFSTCFAPIFHSIIRLASGLRILLSSPQQRRWCC